MGHHIDAQGRFQSDKYPDLAPDKIVLSFKEPAARFALTQYTHVCKDGELVEDIVERLRTIIPTPEPPDA